MFVSQNKRTWIPSKQFSPTQIYRTSKNKNLKIIKSNDKVLCSLSKPSGIKLGDIKSNLHNF